mgnify:CR=1 FL=1
MGNSESNCNYRRAAFNGGYLYVKTDQPYYYPGNNVLGKIYLRLEEPMQAASMNIKVSGREVGQFIYTVYIDEEYKDREGNRKIRKRPESRTAYFNKCLL